MESEIIIASIIIVWQINSFRKSHVEKMDELIERASIIADKPL